MKFAPNRFWKFAFSLEAFKFSLYISIPVMAGVIYANPSVMKDLIMYFKLIEYPESAPAPPVGEEINKFRSQRVLKEAEKNRKNDEQ